MEQSTTHTIAARPARERSGRRIAPLAAVAAVLLAAVAVVAACFWPGHMNADTLTQIQQARDGRYTNQHAPILMWLWHPFYRQGIGPGWILLGQLVTFVAGIYLLLRTTLGRVWSTAVTLLVVAFPPVFGMLGGVTRDAWFTALLVMTYGLTARAVTVHRPRALWYVAGALVVAWLCAASRQNAGFGLAPALVVLAAVLRGGAPRALVAVGAGIAATIAIVTSQFALSAALPIQDISPQQYLYDYDLGALSIDEGRNLFPASALPSRSLAQIQSHWRPEGMSGLTWSADAPVRSPLNPAAAGQLGRAWRDAVTSDPIHYASARATLLGRMLAIGHDANWIYHPVIDPNTFGFKIRFPGLNDDAKSYVQAFTDDRAANTGGVLYTVWVYLLIAAAAAVALFRRHRRALAVVGAFALSAPLLQIGLYVGAPVAEFRFELPTVVAALVSVAVLGGAYARGRRESPGLTTHHDTQGASPVIADTAGT